EPSSKGWSMKVTMEELEEGLEELEMKKEEPRPDVNMTNRDGEDLWVRRWGKFQKVAVKTKFGINKIEVKKPPRPNLKIKFRKV
ncbi:hypothetical protein A2U01_0088057, partial [Trifolium medium]|nr:hypothetical protein [Trifolium medium]